MERSAKALASKGDAMPLPSELGSRLRESQYTFPFVRLSKAVSRALHQLGSHQCDPDRRADNPEFQTVFVSEVSALQLQVLRRFKPSDPWKRLHRQQRPCAPLRAVILRSQGSQRGASDVLGSIQYHRFGRCKDSRRPASQGLGRYYRWCSSWYCDSPYSV